MAVDSFVVVSAGEVVDVALVAAPVAPVAEVAEVALVLAVAASSGDRLGAGIEAAILFDAAVVVLVQHESAADILEYPRSSWAPDPQRSSRRSLNLQL